MTETLPTRKEADFNDVLAGFELFGYCEKEAAPDDLEGLEHYCEALAFAVSGDLMGMRNRMFGHDFAMGKNNDFMEVENMAYALVNTATRILALAQIGVEAAHHLKQLKANAAAGGAS